MRTIFLDFGNVVGFFDHRRATRQFARHTELSEAEVFAAIYGGRLEEDFDCGLITGDEFVATATAAIGYRGSAAEFVTAFADIFTPNDDVCALVPRLARQCRLVLASNTNALHFASFGQTFAATFRHFHALGLSFEAKARKPQPAFFAHCQALARDIDATPLFVDDIRLNVEAARAFGWDALQYTTFPGLTAALRARGIDV